MKPGAVVFSIILILASLAAPMLSDAQQAGKVYRIGYLSPNVTPPDRTPQGCPTKGDPLWQAFVEGLRERGYVQGQNLLVECRYTDTREERAPALAAELVALKLVDALVAHGTTQVLAAKRATTTLPIVMVGVVDPVARGLVASVDHPGGNVTGPMTPGAEIAGKYVYLLKEAVPTLTRLAVLAYASGAPNPAYRQATTAAAEALNLTLQRYDIRGADELAGAFAAMTQAQAEGLFVVTHPFMSTHAQRIVELAAQSKLPAVYPLRSHVDAGGLMSYGYSQPESFRRVGFYVDKILTGAKPSELPVEGTTKYELVINLRTAKMLGLTIPHSLLNRAEVIQ